MSDAGRGANVTTEDDEASTAAATDQDEDDDHVKLLNPVKVHTLFWHLYDIAYNMYSTVSCQISVLLL